LIFVVGAVVAGLVLQRGGLTSLAPEPRTISSDTEFDAEPRLHVCRVRVACR
jgi:hypothetical protein